MSAFFLYSVIQSQDPAAPHVHHDAVTLQLLTMMT